MKVKNIWKNIEKIEEIERSGKPDGIEEKMVEMVSNEPNWEEVLNYVVSEEGMDPWQIDIVKLANAFASFIQRLGEMDFKIPAKLIIIAAILLRLKVEVLMYEEEEEETIELENIEEMKIDIDLSKIPDIQAPIKR
ncbi:MAG: hypothetical protein DRP11_01635, partial [Candidatus Aenigmatarchaeota archaeon]